MSSVDQALIRLHTRKHAPPPAPPDLGSREAFVTSPAHVISAVAMPTTHSTAGVTLESVEHLAVSQWRIDTPAPSSTPLAGPHFLPATKAAPAAKTTPPVKTPPAAEAEAKPEMAPPSEAAPAPAVPATMLAEHQATCADAAWSVDHFQHSETCTRLLKRAGAKLTALCERLTGAADVSQRVVVLSSAARGEGRTTLAICFAETAARLGARVALVDGDLECPALARELGLSTECNWARGLRRGLPLAESCVRSLENRLTVAPLAERIRPAEMPTPQEVADMLRRLAADHDLVVVDGPPLAPADVDVAAAASADTFGRALLVRDVRRTADEALTQLVVQLEMAGLAPQGVIENFSNT